MFSKSESGGSRPSSITRSSRGSYASEFQSLPSEATEYSFELNEEVLDVEDISEDESPTKLDIKKMKELKLSDNQGGDIGDNADKCEDSGDNQVSVEKNVSPECVESKLEIKIRKGLEKVKKLDEILTEKIKEEKEAKQSRYALEKQFQSEVAALIQEKGADKVCGSQQLIHLCATSDHRDIDGEHEIQPIFHTQIDAEYYKDKIEDSESNIDSVSSTSNYCASETGSKSEKAKKGKDFVKRNIQLASQAQELIPLTDEEKKRLDDLLADDSDLLMVENPFSAPSIANNAYQFSNDELNSLEKINDRLKELIPVEDVSLVLSDDNFQEIGKFDRTNEFSPHSEDIILIDSKCGEQVLQEGHDERSVSCRLHDIEQRLAQLRYDEEGDGQLIDPDLLRKLLDVDSRLTSDSVSVCDSLRSKSVIFSDVDSVVTGSEIGLENDTNDQLNLFIE